MKKLFIIFLFTGLCGLNALGQSCRVDIIALEAKIKSQPESVLFALGDAIALRPDCLADLIETAVKATEKKPGAVSEIVKLAVSEYPDKAALIAESAVIASPDNVDVIRKAFQAAKSGTYKPKYIKGKLPANPSPIERYLSNYKTSKPTDPNDAANEGLRAIDAILAKIKNKEIKVAGPEEAKKKALVALPVVPVKPKVEVETFRMAEIDEQSITTINDPAHHDKVDEMLPVEQPTLVVQDPAATGPNLVEVIKKKKLKQAAQKKKEMAALMESTVFSSSVYQIPSPNPDGLTSVSNTILRSQPLSPTRPVAR